MGVLRKYPKFTCLEHVLKGICTELPIDRIYSRLVIHVYCYNFEHVCNNSIVIHMICLEDFMLELYVQFIMHAIYSPHKLLVNICVRKFRCSHGQEKCKLCHNTVI